ncbi:hypothetical protein N7494_004563 [Penicillium frequentans]|uniref:Magnesium transporter NIPA2 n=1 Tax=Penicillium frequentans TaxID=3151616 RepID=A0AAD6D0V8_9EURO|nr:hypothetical protein N7494_004563 [Penicillium glabrum]
MDAHTLSHASTLLARADSSSRPSYYKAIGISLAVASGVFIGISFVLKKVGLLRANVKYNEEAGEGYGYLKNFLWWTGMTLMIIGEICNFVAYAFVDAILVTPLGALSVVITTVLSAIFLKERLSFVGKVGCFSCIVGSVVIALNAPEQSSVSNIQEMQHYVIAPGFLTYAGVIIVGSIFTAFWAGPRYGKKSMFVYISICSMVGGLSVVATQGLGSAIIAWIGGEPQYKQWFLWVLLVFVVCTLLTEIIFLNKALNLFNAALVTPTYYVMFTSATIVTSAILFQGFKGTATEITTVIMGFLQICTGVVLLQISKSAKDVPDAAVFKGDLDQIREVVTQEEPESEPRADSIRGAASIIRRISTARRTMESDEARRFFHDKNEDSLKPPGENEIIEWDGLRRRKTVLGQGPTMSRASTPRSPSIKQQFPPLGMSHFPDPEDEEDRPTTKQSGHSFLSDTRSRMSSLRHPQQWIPLKEQDEKKTGSQDAPVSQDDDAVDTEYHGATARPFGRERSDTPRSIAWADEKADDSSLEPPVNTARRQFSFNSVLSRMKPTRDPSPKRLASPPRGILRRTTNSGTEEERLGLVKGDSRTVQPEESLGEKLERWSSSESDLNEVQPQPLRTSRPHGDSVSSMSTAAFPPYEDHHHALYSAPGASGSNPYYLPPTRQAASPEHVEEYDGWQLPPSSARGHNRTRTNSSTQGRAPPPSQSSFSTHRHPNPLPSLPDETAMGVRSVSSGSSDMGVASITSSTEAQDTENTRPYRVSRQNSGWRRHMSELSSHDGEPPEGRGNGRGGAFV